MIFMLGCPHSQWYGLFLGIIKRGYLLCQLFERIPRDDLYHMRLMPGAGREAPKLNKNDLQKQARKQEARPARSDTYDEINIHDSSVVLFASATSLQR